MNSTTFSTLANFTDFKREHINLSSVLKETYTNRFYDKGQPDIEPELTFLFEERLTPIKTTDTITKELEDYFNDLKSPYSVIKGNGEDVHIGIDTEFEYDDENNRNKIISYQYYMVTPDEQVIKEVIYPDSFKPEDRFDFNEFIYYILLKAKRYGYISEYPTNTYVYAHFMRADIASFNAYWKIGNKKLDQAKATLDSARGSYGLDLAAIGKSMHRTPPVTFNDYNNKKQSTRIKLKDTLFLSPGRCSLKVIGKAIGIEKIELPAPYSIEKMSELLAGDKHLFEQYALRDAEIAVRYGLKMQQFALKDLHDGTISPDGTGLVLKNIPNTLGNLSVSLFKHTSAEDGLDFNLVFGMEKITSQRWSATSGRVITTDSMELTGERDRNEATARRCFYGGRNEDYLFGPSSKTVINDFDLVGAYTTGLVDILPVDYRGAFSSKDINDYLGHTMGFAYVRFKFKEGTRFPSLPVRSGVYGLYYPMEGETYCTAPEIAVAYSMGCDLEILYGDVIPWVKGSQPIFESFTRVIRKLRKAHEGTFDEKIIKEIGNTLYGKVSQNVGREKTSFDKKTGLSKSSGHSPVTNSYFASHVTGFIRAVLSEMLAAIPDSAEVYSATTDGFLTNLPEEHLSMDGPITSRFNALCSHLGDDSMIKLKHKVGQIIGMKTRGQLTAELLDDDGVDETLSMLLKKPVIAKAGVKPPQDCANENDWMVNLFLTRESGQKIPNNSFVSERDQYLYEMDGIMIKRDKFLNLEFDFKRKPVNPTMVKVRNPITDEIVEHIQFDTVPWQTQNDAQLARACFDGWRREKCLKTMEDWADWTDHYKIKTMVIVKNQKSTKNGSEDMLKRDVLTAITNNSYGLSKNFEDGKTRTYSMIAAEFTKAGFKTSEKDVKNSKGRKVHKYMLPAVSKLIPLLVWLIERNPKMDTRMFFIESEFDEVMQLVNDYQAAELVAD